MLIMLQCVLGLDNLLYISLESKTAPKEKQAMVRALGIGIAIFLRVGLLLIMRSLQDFFDVPIFQIDWSETFHWDLNLHGLIFIAGGIFIVYTAMKEIWHMIASHKAPGESVKKRKRSVTTVIIWIVLMNVIFSIDSILSAMMLTENYLTMAVAIVLGGLLMIWLSGTVSRFLEKNKLYEVLGLFILFIVGVMLLSEGGHISHMSFGGHMVEAMSKSTFYFVIIVLVLVEIVQSRYQKNLLKRQKAIEEAATDGLPEDISEDQS